MSPLYHPQILGTPHLFPLAVGLEARLFSRHRVENDGRRGRCQEISLVFPELRIPRIPRLLAFRGNKVPRAETQRTECHALILSASSPPREILIWGFSGGRARSSIAVHSLRPHRLAVFAMVRRHHVAARLEARDELRGAGADAHSAAAAKTRMPDRIMIHRSFKITLRKNLVYYLVSLLIAPLIGRLAPYSPPPPRSFSRR